MCRRARCTQCGKVTWKGCGAHVQQVLAGVAADQRCGCASPRPEGLLSMLKRLISGG